MAVSYPVEARYMEYIFAEVMVQKKWVSWRSVCHFTLKNRAKFFDESDTSISRFLSELMGSDNYEFLQEASCISALHRCRPRDSPKSSQHSKLDWLQYIPYTYRDIFRELGSFLSKYSKEQYDQLCELYEEILPILTDSKFPVCNADVIKIIDRGYDILADQKILSRRAIFAEMLAHLMIRYAIQDKTKFDVICPDTFLTRFFYRIFILSSPQKLGTVELSFKGYATVYDFQFETFLNFYDYFTEETKQSLLKLADSSRSSLKFASLSLRLEDVKKFETEIASEICRFHFYDELIDFVKVTEHHDLSETSKLQIFAHWFFVDEFERFSELNSTVFLIGVCAGSLERN
jgi:hypothetical protein